MSHERIGEMALIDEATFKGDLGERQARLTEQVLGERDPFAQKPLIRRDADSVAERAHEMTERKPADPRDLRDGDLGRKMRAHRLLRAPNLPGRELRRTSAKARRAHARLARIGTRVVHAPPSARGQTRIVAIATSRGR
jgi:hypothetical protein